MELILAAANRAVAEDVGLLVTFLGIGALVGVIIAFIAVQVHGEHQQNREHRSSLRHEGDGL